MNKVVGIIIGSIVVVLLGVFIFLGVYSAKVKCPVSSKTWERSISIQKYDWVSHEKHKKVYDDDIIGFLTRSDYYPSVPAGGRIIDRWTRRDYDTETDKNGDKSRNYYTKYYIKYEIKEWSYSRTVSIKGSQSEEVKWPDVVFNTDLQERESERHENYTINFNIHNKEKQYTTSNFYEYENLKSDTNYECTINGYGFITNVKTNIASVSY